MNARTTKAIAKMKVEKDFFTDLAERLSLEELERPLAKDEWSINGVIEHLVIVEGNLALALARPKDLPAPTLKNKIMWRGARVIQFNGIKIPVPIPEVNPTGADPTQVLAKWEKSRAKILKQIEEAPDLTSRPFAHPILGPLDYTQCAEFVANHIVYHRVRTQKLLKVRA